MGYVPIYVYHNGNDHVINDADDFVIISLSSSASSSSSSSFSSSSSSSSKKGIDLILIKQVKIGEYISQKIWLRKQALYVR